MNYRVLTSLTLLKTLVNPSNVLSQSGVVVVLDEIIRSIDFVIAPIVCSEIGYLSSTSS